MGGSAQYHIGIKLGKAQTSGVSVQIHWLSPSPNERGVKKNGILPHYHK